MDDLSKCLAKIGFSCSEVSLFIYDGIDSLATLKIRDDDEISHFLRDHLTTRVRGVKNLAYYLRHLDRIQRPFDLNNITIEKLEEMKVMKDFEKEQRGRVVSFPSVSDGINSAVTIATCYLGQTYGCSGIPLTYVVRKLTDPDPQALYTTVYEEMIARAPLTGFHFERDNEKVWFILLGIFTGYHVVEEFRTTKDGRGAYFSLCRTHRGHQFELLA
jgi:hypothetical protein